MTILFSSRKTLKIGAMICLDSSEAIIEIVGFSDPDNWTRYAGNPILEVGGIGAWDHNWIHPHSVLIVGDEYWMYYGGSASGGLSGVPNRIGLATSSDGYTWTKYGSNPIFTPSGSGWDSASVETFTILKVGSNWFAWYAGNSAATPPGHQIGYATSEDGITWTRYASNPVITLGAGGTWDSVFVYPCSVLEEDGIYYLYYFGTDSYGTPSNWKIGLATSTDRVTWTKHASNPIFSGASGQWDSGLLDVHVMLLGNTYYMFYQGNTSTGEYSAIGVATSTDKIAWTRAATNPFPRGANGSWDDTWNEGPVLIQIGDTWLMYYMGQPGGGPMEIGVMTFSEPV